MAAREVAHLRLPIGVVGREFVQEEDRRSAARLLEIQADIVGRDGVGHLRFLLVSRASKIAVNARDCNAAELISFVMESARELPRKRFRTAASHLALATSELLRARECRPRQGRWGKGVSTKDLVCLVCSLRSAGRLSRWLFSPRPSPLLLLPLRQGLITALIAHACALCRTITYGDICAAAVLRSAAVLRQLDRKSRLPAGRVSPARGAQRGADAVAAVCRHAGERDAV